jgi:hypothetical protein
MIPMMQQSLFDAAPPSLGMRFFTPDLFLRFNSEVEEEADAAEDEWEVAIEEYQEHCSKLKAIAPHLGSLIALNLHDATFDDFERELGVDGEAMQLDGVLYHMYHKHFYFHELPFRSIRWNSAHSLGLTVRRGGYAAGLLYSLWDMVGRLHFNFPEWSLDDHRSRNRPHIWLYDEIDVVWWPSSLYVHRVLLNDMSTLIIPFHTVSVVELAHPEA